MKSFIIKCDSNWFKKNEILDTPSGVRLKVTKVYKYNLWRKFLHLLGIKFKMFNCVRLKEI